MVGLRRKLISAFLAITILVAAVAVPGCKKEQPTKQTTKKQAEKKASDTKSQTEKALKNME